MPINGCIRGIRGRVAKGRNALVLGEPPRKMAYAVRQTREMMSQLTALVVKVHGKTSVHHLQLIGEWAEAEVSRRLMWLEFREKYPHKLTTEQVCMVRKDTQRYAAEKSRCIKELQLDVKLDAFSQALEDEIEVEPVPLLGENELSPEGYENSAKAFRTTCEEAGVEYSDVSQESGGESSTVAQ